jgi:hypothetical protein
MRKSIFLTVLLGLFLVSTVIADPGDTLWTRTYGGSNHEGGYSVQQTTDGGYIIAGHTMSFGAGGYDLYLVKTDPNGDTLWTRTYGGSNYDYGYSVQQTSDGGYIVAGYTYSFGAGSADVWLIKTDANGDALWTRTYGGSDYDFGWCVQHTSDGGYIVAGYTYSFGAGLADVYLVKTDANGDTLWTRTYGGSGEDYGYGVQQLSNGGYIIAGGTGPVFYLTDVYLVKTDSTGDTLWTRTYGGSNSEIAHSVQQTTDGGYIIAGTTAPIFDVSDVYVVKTDATGDTLWTRTYGGSNFDFGECVQQTTDGGYVVAGYTESFGAGGTDVYLVKTDSKGDTLWTCPYGGSGSDFGYSVQQTADGGYVVTGYTDSFGAGGRDVWLLRLAGEAPEPDVSIEIVPDDPPVTVPQGGSFGFTGTVTNNTENPQTTDMWVMAIGPTKEIYGPFKEFYDFYLDPGQSRTADFNQRVKGAAPLGFYDYIAYCGDYPSTVMDSSFFQVEVVEGLGSSQTGWVLTGSFLEGDLADLPSEFALLGNYPNPFNASTVISYELPTETHVKLEVYNISGQKVATVVDGQQEAGYRSVLWDASGTSSGIYLYKLTAGDYTEIKTMTLLR